MVSKGFDGVEELAATTANFVVAAAESPASAMAHMLEMISNNGRVEEELKKEILAHSGDKKDKSWVKLLTYAGAVIDEAIRLKAPATMVAREALIDVKVPAGGDGKFIEAKKGTKFNLCLHALHLRQQAWGPDVGEFKPERWLSSEKAGGGAYMPFSQGPRGCPGKAVTVMWMKVLLATMCEAGWVLTKEDTASDQLDLVEEDSPDNMAVKVGTQSTPLEHCNKYVSWLPNGVNLKVRR